MCSDICCNVSDSRVSAWVDIIEVIGEGSFGRVFKGKKKDNGEIFALKVMKK